MILLLLSLCNSNLSKDTPARQSRSCSATIQMVFKENCPFLYLIFLTPGIDDAECFLGFCNYGNEGKWLLEVLKSQSFLNSE